MKLEITGNLRSVANSAWVSTLDESKAKDKDDLEVIRVTNFLVENHHTTPFESVTLSFYFDNLNEEESSYRDYWEMSPFLTSYVRHFSSEDGSSAIITTDLFNFIKVCKKSIFTDDGLIKDYHDTTFWRLFSSQDPVLSEVVDKFSFSENIFVELPDLEEVLGKNSISVELVSVHDSQIPDHRRMTWRICCPLSIAVQMLRHRTGSFNMTSGRYRTLNQDMVDIYQDVVLISRKLIGKDGESSDLAIKQIFGKNQQSFEDYQWLMNLAKDSKKQNLISNDEYKRFREYARYILPEGRMTELYVSFYWNDFVNYLCLRESTHAQVEHAYVAQKMRKVLFEKNKNFFDYQ